jgi:hypothetical protein
MKFYAILVVYNSLMVPIETVKYVQPFTHQSDCEDFAQIKAQKLSSGPRSLVIGHCEQLQEMEEEHNSR